MENIEIKRISIDHHILYKGRRYRGLKELKAASIGWHNIDKQTWTKPYVVEVSERYPCFDSYDYADENRYYQMFYLTDSILKVRCICDENEQRSFVKEELYPIINPEYNPKWIHERHLPFVYYRGEGHILFLVQSRKAGFKDKVRTYDPYNTLLHRLRRWLKALCKPSKKNTAINCFLRN